MAIFGGCNHVLMTMRLLGKSSTIYAQESWQVGWRLAFPEGGPLGKDSGRVELPVRSVQDAIVARQITEFNVDQGWSGVTEGGTTITDADQDTAALSTLNFLTAIKALTSVNYELESVRLYPVGANGRSLTAPSVYRPRITTQNPTSSTMLPPDVALAISTTTATRGVKGRGRVFIGAPGAGVIDGAGAVTSAARTTLVNAQVAQFNALRAMSTGAGDIAFTPIIWHRTGDKAGIEDGTYGSPIRAVRVDDRCDTQRRRDRQVAHNWTTTVLA